MTISCSLGDLKINAWVLKQEVQRNVTTNHLLQPIFLSKRNRQTTVVSVKKGLRIEVYLSSINKPLIHLTQSLTPLDLVSCCYSTLLSSKPLYARSTVYPWHEVCQQRLWPMKLVLMLMTRTTLGIICVELEHSLSSPSSAPPLVLLLLCFPLGELVHSKPFLQQPF